MKLFRSIVVPFLLLIPVLVFAAAPLGYYSALNGKKDADLKTAAHSVIRNFTKSSSNDAIYSGLPDYFRKTDIRPGTNYWWDMYSSRLRNAGSFSGLNREHSFPKSWWGGSTSVNAYIDLNHLYPSDQSANTAKSNYPLGTVDRNSTITFDNGVALVGYPVNGQGGLAPKVFEPDDDYKGDFARTYFYMVTCYQDYSWATKYAYMLEQNTYPTLSQWAVDLLLKWHRQDPVDQKEIDRNEAVYKIQNNRNPFIDLPELAEYIWGTKKGEPFSPGEVIVPPTGDPVLLSPVKDMELDFGQVAIGNSATTQLFVSGQFLQGTIKAQVYTADAAMFTASETKIPADQVCSENGYWLNIVYDPTTIGSHTARVLLSGDFGSCGVALKGECFPVPILSACTATEPTDIESDSYTANWTAPDGEDIDYFIVTRTRYTGANVVTEEIVAEENYALIDDFDGSDSEAYSVQSVRLGYRSPMSNVVFVEHSGISGVETQQPLVVKSFNGFIRFICSQPQDNCRIYDAAGRLFRFIDRVEQNLDIELPYGVYFITTDAHPAPVKAVVR
ncbi:MAG: endonuclease [Muribaculaceae bacterium]|nr:endonuclease [Muribaculaceae bacterium]